MAPSSHQPLLNNPSTSKHYCRTLFTFFFIAAILSTATLVSINLIKPSSSNLSSLSWVCDKAHNKPSCLSLVSELLISQEETNQLNEIDLLQMFLMKSLPEIAKVRGRATFLSRQINSPRDQAALVDCMELMDESMMRIRSSTRALEKRTSTSNKDAHAWLSTVLTNHVTCLDGLSGPARPNMEDEIRGLISRASASLAMFVAATSSAAEEEDVSFFKPLAEYKFPSWVTTHDRKLLETSPGNINADVTVAKDGSGKYKTVAEAVAAAPTNSKTRYTIYVKKGTYKENVQIASNKKNLMLVGDGMDLTIITGSLNVVDGSTTFNSATVAAVGDGFMAQDIWFQNTAGAAKHQAVALRVGSDQSVINRCKIDAYQDTLYAHSNRQFYRDSYITGTVDFIFGNAAVVFQNCNLVPRKPMSGQGNMVTAQGRTDPNQSTGTSIQGCKIVASSDLEPVKSQFKSYLGRPWKEYSRTVVMQSSIGDLIDPAGWSIWSGDFALSTLYYGEYMNTGAGAGTSKRVTWAGFHVITSAADAKPFTVAELIQGGSWLKSTGVSYTEGL